MSQNNKNNNISSQKILGAFYPYGGIIEINYSYDFYKNAVKYFYEDLELNIIRKSKERKEISNGEFRKYSECVSTWTHEAHHLFHFFSSPLSLLVHFLLKMRTSYRQQISFSIISNDNSIEIYRYKKCIEDIKFIISCLFSDGYYKISRTIKRFNEFMPLLNEFYRDQFSNIGELYKISTNLPRRAFSSPSKTITPLRLMESYSYITEKLVLTQLVASNSNKYIFFSDINFKDKNNIYSDAFKYYLDKLSVNEIEYYHYTTFLLLVDLSFKTPFEPNYMSVFKSNIWENLHPSYRFDMLLSIIRNVGFWKKATDYKEYSDKLCDLLRWPTLSQINQTSEIIKYIPGTNEKGIDAFQDIHLDALTKYVLKTHRTVNIINEKWPYGPYSPCKEFLDYFHENFKPPFSIFSNGYIKYDPIDIFLPRLKEFLMYVIAFDLDNMLFYKNILQHRDILFNSKDIFLGDYNYIDDFIGEDDINEICDKLVRGVFRSFGANYDSL